MADKDIYISPTKDIANTPVRQTLIKCDKKLALFLSQLDSNIQRSKKVEKKANCEDICQGIENINFNKNK